MKAVINAPVVFLRLLYQSIYLALGQIWANKSRSILTTIGIVIGVASVTAVIATLTGLRAKVLADFESFGTNKIYISPRRPHRGRRGRRSWWTIRFQPQHFDGMLEHCPSVERFTRISWGGHHTIRHGEKSIDGVHVRGIDPAWTRIENRPVILGRPFSVIDQEQGRQICLIEPELRDELRLDRDCIGQSILMAGRTFHIVGVVEKRPQMTIGGERGEGHIELYIPFRTNWKLGNQWFWVIAATKSTHLAPDAKAELAFFLRRTRNIKPGEPDTFRVQSVESELRKFNQIAVMITLVAGGIVGISLLVGGIGIMNIMFVSVSERTREIGLRKAVGARKSAVLTQFLVEAVVLCFIGGLIGVGLGHVLTSIIAAVNPVLDKTHIPAWAIIISFGFAGSVGVFFGMFPAIKAARLDPIEALRHE